MERKPVDEAGWQPWVQQVAASVELDDVDVSISDIHELTGAVAKARARAMGPVAAYIWGVARSQYPDQSPDELRRSIVEAARRQ